MKSVFDSPSPQTFSVHGAMVDDTSGGAPILNLGRAASLVISKSIEMIENRRFPEPNLPRICSGSERWHLQ
jgi:hypothetical protein